jgi:hypothetical protein
MDAPPTCFAGRPGDDDHPDARQHETGKSPKDSPVSESQAIKPRSRACPIGPDPGAPARGGFSRPLAPLRSVLRIDGYTAHGR